MAHQCGSKRQPHVWEFVVPALRGRQLRKCTLCPNEEVVRVCKEGLLCADCKAHGCMMDVGQESCACGNHSNGF